MGWIVLSATIFLLVVGYYAKLRNEHLEILQELRADFFRSSANLIEDDDTPDEIIRRVEVLAKVMGWWGSPWLLLVLLLSGEIARAKPGPEWHRAIASLREPLRRQYFEMAVSGVLAVTYKSTLVGWLIRRMALYSLPKPGRHNDGDSGDAEVVVSGLSNRWLKTA